MPISQYLFDKWDQRLSNWASWMYGGAQGSEGVSSVYDPDSWRRGAARASTSVVLIGEAQDTYRMLLLVKARHERLFHALDQWAQNHGTRGAQAARLSIHQDTYRDWVDSGMRMLQDLSTRSTRPEIKRPRISPEKG